MRLVTFNILSGRSTRDGLVDLDRLATAVRSLDPDVLALQEVDRDQPRSQHADLTAVCAEAMGAVAWRFVPALLGTPGEDWAPAAEASAGPSVAAGGRGAGGPAYGIALLSRWPVRTWSVLRLPRIRPRLPWWNPWRHRLVRVVEEPRVAVVGRIETPAGLVSVANTHLSFLPGWGRVQLRSLVHGLRPLPPPVVMMGDLNLDHPRPGRITGYRSLAALRTFPADRPDRQLDHVLLRGRLGGVVRADAPELELSDHRPLVVELDDGRA